MIGRSESTCVAAALLILCITAPLASPQRASGQDVAVVPRAAERAGARQFFLDLRGAPTTGVVGEWLSEPRGMFVATSVYSPEWGATSASYPTSLATLFDGVAFFQTTTAARPLPLGDCPDQIYR